MSGVRVRMTVNGRADCAGKQRRATINRHDACRACRALTAAPESRRVSRDVAKSTNCRQLSHMGWKGRRRC